LKIVELPKDQSVHQAIQEFMDRADNFDGVMLIALNKDSSQFMVTSKMSGIEKAFLVQFANAAMNKWFEV
jgi:hypothetical protein